MIPAFDTAIDLLKKESDPLTKILNSSAYWIPLQWVYVEMIKNKDLVRLSDLEKVERLRFWNLVKDIDGPQWKKIQLAQALYVFENIK